MTTFVPNPHVDEAITEDEIWKAQVQRLAEAGLEIAQRLVPVDTGELRDSLHIEDTEDGGKRIVAETDHWQFPEFGTSTEPAQPYLRPIIDALGLHR